MVYCKEYSHTTYLDSVHQYKEKSSYRHVPKSASFFVNLPFRFSKGKIVSREWYKLDVWIMLVALEDRIKSLSTRVKEININTLNDVFGLKDLKITEIIKDKENQYEELKAYEKQLDGKELDVYQFVKNNFERYMQIHIVHIMDGLMKQHSSEMETAISDLKQEHSRNLKVIESNLKNIFVKEESLLLKKMEKTYINEIESLKWILGSSYSGTEGVAQDDSKAVLERLNRSIISEYSSSLKVLLDSWMEKYGETLSQVNDELKSSVLVTSGDKMNLYDLSKCETSKFDFSKADDVNKLLDLKERLLNHAEELKNSVKESYNAAIEDIKASLEQTHGKVIDVVQELKLQLNKGILIASLEDKVRSVEAEKDQLEDDHKTAITLLLKDHEVELSVVNSLLDKFQPQCTEHCSDIDAVLKQKSELEAKHSQQLEELRIYYEKKFTEVEKNFSEDIYSHHSRKLSCSSSCSEGELNSDVCQPAGVEDIVTLSNEIATVKEEHTYFSKDIVEQSDEEVQTDFHDFLSDYSIDFNVEPGSFHSHPDVQEIKLLKQTNNEYENEIKKLKRELHDMKKLNSAVESSDSETSTSNVKTETVVEIKPDIEIDYETKFIDKIDLLQKELSEKNLKLKKVTEDYEDKIKLLIERYENEIEGFRIKLDQFSRNIVEKVDKINLSNFVHEEELNKDNVVLENVNSSQGNHRNNEEMKSDFTKINKEKPSSNEISYEEKVDEMQKLLNTISHSRDIEENVKKIVEDVRIAYQSEYERKKFNFLQKTNEKQKNEVQTMKEDLIHYTNLLKEEHERNETEKKLLKENYDTAIENLKSHMKCQEKDRIWSVTVELEERYRNKISEVNQFWEDKLAELLANAATEYSLQKVTMETKLREILKKDLETENNRIHKVIREQEKENALAELAVERDTIIKEFCHLNNELKKEIEEKQAFVDDKERVIKELTNSHELVVWKIQSQHEQQIQYIKQAHAEELEKAYYEVKKTNTKDSSVQCDQEMLVDQARIEVLSALEEQIKILVAEGDDPDVKSNWPPELATLERQFTAKYQQQLAAIVKDHAVEMTELKTQYQSKIQLLVENCSCKASRGLADALNEEVPEDNVLNKIIKERDSLRKLTVALRGVVCELAKYLNTCEDELNNTLINELVKCENFSDCSQLTIVDVSEQNSDLESDEIENDTDVSVVQATKRVHFAPNVTTILDDDSFLDCLDGNHDLSVDLRSELQSCLERLKLEAAAVLGLSTLKNKDSSTTVERRRLASVTRQLIEKNKFIDELTRNLEDARETNIKLNQDLNDIQAELALEKDRHERERAEVVNRVETVFDDAVIGMEARLFNLSQLQEKAKSLVDKTKQPELPAQLVVMVEEMCRQGDQLLEEARKEREDLQMQVDAADKQLRNTREFLEEQAAERESERDEFSRELALLREQLRDKDRDWTTRERFATEWSTLENGDHESTKGKGRNVEALEQQVMETTNLLKETQMKKDEVESELKDAIDKVWVLREVIRDLESQVSFKSERQATLEQHLDALESELEAQNKAQNALALELEAMREEANSDDHINHLRQLEEQFKKQCSSSVLRQIKSQLREMAKSLQKRTKDLEGLNVHISSASLSSPSEDISIREQLDMFRCGSSTPEGCQSPVALPVEEISLLQEQLQRHARAEELAVKRIRDQDLQLSHLRSQYEDVLAERDVLQDKCDKQFSQLAATQTKLDNARRKAEWEQTKSDALLIEKISHLEEELVSIQKAFKLKEKEVVVVEQRMAYLENQIANKDAELCSHVDTQNKHIDLLQHELSVMEVEKKKLEVMIRKCKDGQNMSIPALMEEILAEKNADIDYLEQKVKELQASQTNNSFMEEKLSSVRTSHSNSKGYHVSFADNVKNPEFDSERTRDAVFDSSNSVLFQPFFNNNVILNDSSQNSSCNNTPQHPDIALQNLAAGLNGAGGDYSPKWTAPLNPASVQVDELYVKIEELKQDLQIKANTLKEYEERLKEIPALESELKQTRDELKATLTSVAEDKKYCQEQLDIISEFQRKYNDKECEVEKLRDQLSQKEENLIRVTADVKALQLVLDKLQEKINDAKECAKFNNDGAELQSVKEENIRLNQEKLLLKNELDKVSSAEIFILKQSLDDEKEIEKNLKTELENVQKEKEIILSQLDFIKNDCDSYRSKFDDVFNKLKNCEKEVNRLQSELKISVESNVYLNKALADVRTELKDVSAKAKLDMENHLKKDSEDVTKLKEELERLKNINTGLESDCNKLRSELAVPKQNVDLNSKMISNEERIMELEQKLLELEMENRCLMDDKIKAEHIAEIERERHESLNTAAEAYRNSEKIAQEAAVKEKSCRISSEKKLQFIKREYEKMKRSKKELEKKNTVLREELEKEKKHTSALEEGSSKRRKSTESLSSTPVDTFEVKPICDNLTGSLDDLAGQVQKELDTSAQLDNSLLSTLDSKQTVLSNLPSEYILGILQKIIRSGFQSISSDEAATLHSQISSKIEVKSTGLANMMERLSELSSVIQNQKETIENLKDQLSNERLRFSKERENVVKLQAEGEHLQNIISYQEERLTSLSVTVDESKKRNSDLEICVLKERGNFKKLQILLENEREKVKQIQREDTELIQDLRICLEEAKDSEVRLQLCLEQERDRLQTLEAQLNAARVVEQYFSQPSSDTDKLSKCLDDLKSKYTELGVELEREKRNVESLSVSLNKEKTLSGQLRTKLHSTHAENIHLQAQVDDLKLLVAKEQKKKSETEDKVKTIQEAEIRRQRSRAAAEERHRKSLDRAKLQKIELEAEVMRLRKQLAEAQNEDIAASGDFGASIPLLLQIKGVNVEIEKLVKDKEELTRKVATLLERNKELKDRLSKVSESSKYHNKDTRYYMGLYMRNRSHKKSLIWQKRYLMLALQGYQESGQKLLKRVSEGMQNTSWVPENFTKKKLSFKLVALTVVAIARMKSIVRIRRSVLGISCTVPSPKREHLLQQQRFRSLSPRDVQGPSSLSPPIRDLRFAQRGEPVKSTTPPVLLQPTRLADYLETFNELQSRLSQALGSPQKELSVDRTIISRVLN